MTNKLPQWLTLLVAALLLAGCATTRHLPNVTVYDASVAIDRVDDHRLDGGEFQVVVFAHSTSRFPQSIRHRALWADAQGRPIKTTVSTWNEMSLDPNRPFTIQFVAPGSRAKAYRIEIEGMERN